MKHLETFKEKRIYSLNLIAYITYKTNVMPVLRLDEEGKYYGLFPETRGIAWAITEFRRDNCKVYLHSFLQNYKELRLAINQLKEGNSNG